MLSDAVKVAVDAVRGFSEEIRVLELDQLDATERAAVLNFQIATIEAEVAGRISRDTTLTNADQRKTRVAEELRGHAEHTTLKIQADELRILLLRKSIQLSAVRRNHQEALLVAQYHANRGAL